MAKTRDNPRPAWRSTYSVAIIVGIIAVFLLPYLWMVASGLKLQHAIFSDVSPISWRTFAPVGATLENLRTLFTERGLGSALINSSIVAAIQVVGSTVVCSMAAYALTRLRFRGRGLLFAAILATFMVPTEAMVVPLYNVMAGLGLQDTLPAVALPWIASAFGLFLLKQHFEEVPRELDDAARMDGAGHIRIFWNVILPNVRTALATQALIIFLFSWNSFLWPLVVIQSPEKQLVQVSIAQSVAPGELPNWGTTFAGAAVATIPLIVLFIVLQRYFVKGLATTGIK